MGEVGTISQDDKDGTPYKIRFVGKGDVSWFKEAHVRKGGSAPAQSKPDAKVSYIPRETMCELVWIMTRECLPQSAYHIYVVCDRWLVKSIASKKNLNK